MKNSILLTILLFFSASAIGTELPLTAKSVFVVDADNSEILYQKNSEEVRSIASITKLMTAVVTLDAKLPLDEIITITSDDVIATTLRGRKTSSSLPVGTRLTREELLHLTLMNSQNRAAAALARTYPGGSSVFVEAMNTTASSLGMTNTHYTDPTGLLSSNKSTAGDLAILLRHASTYPIICEFSTAKSFSFNRHTFGSTNKLVTRSDWDILIQKTGYVQEAGRCVVMMANVAGRRAIIVLLSAVGQAERAKDAITIKYWVEHGTFPTKSQLAQLNPYKNSKHHTKQRKRYKQHKKVDH